MTQRSMVGMAHNPRAAPSNRPATKNQYHTAMNLVIRYLRDSRRSRLDRALRKMPLTFPTSLVRLVLGSRGGSTDVQRCLCLLMNSWNRSARNVRAWRYQQGRRLWSRVRTSRAASYCYGVVAGADPHGHVLQGSRPRCICRFFFCTFCIMIFLVVCIIICLALVRPPGPSPFSPST